MSHTTNKVIDEQNHLREVKAELGNIEPYIQIHTGLNFMVSLKDDVKTNDVCEALGVTRKEIITTLDYLTDNQKEVMHLIGEKY